MKIPEITGVRKMVAIALTMLFCWMVLREQVNAEQMIPIYTMVLGFYFGRSTALDVPGERKDNHE